MELKVDSSVIKSLVADHLSRMTQKKILAKDVHIYYDPMCEEITHAFTYIDDELEDKPKKNIFNPQCNYFVADGRYCTGEYDPYCIIKSKEDRCYYYQRGNTE